MTARVKHTRTKNDIRRCAQRTHFLRAARRVGGWVGGTLVAIGTAVYSCSRRTQAPTLCGRGSPPMRLRAVACQVLAATLLVGPATGGCADWCNKWICSNPSCLDCGCEIGCPCKPPMPPPPPPRPHMPPYDYPRLCPGALEFYGEKGRLYGNGRPFHIKGVNWFGTENRAGPPLGLDRHDLAWYMKWLKRNKFNAIRLWAHQRPEHVHCDPCACVRQLTAGPGT